MPRKVPVIYSRILSLFPENIQFAFAYGSGVFRQGDREVSRHRHVQGVSGSSGHSMQNMIDLVLVVKDPLRFHEENMKRNRSHYSFLKYGGAALVTQVQQELGAHVYFNTLVPFEDRYIKYGIVSQSFLIADLLDWETLYLSGRLHKPVLVLRDSDDSILKSALRMNLQNAAHTALLFLPERFTEEEFYVKVTSLSYTGDFRMWAGEDRHKVKKIVGGSYEQFRELYADILGGLQPYANWSSDKEVVEQDWSPAARLHHLNLLPKHLQLFLYKSWNKDGRQRDLEDVLKVIAYDIDCEAVVQEGVDSIVWQSSWSQSIKGIIMAGISKSVRYSAAKLEKMVRSWL